MSPARILSRFLPVFVVCIATVPSYAQWAKTDGPDSVQVLVTASSSQVYAGTKHGVFTSTDAGETWVESNTGLTNLNVRAFAFTNVLHRGTLFAGTAAGVFRTADSGATWEEANNGLANLDVRSVAFSQGQRSLLAATGGGVFLSADSGGSWTEINTGLPNLDVRAVLYRDTGTFITTDSGDYRYAIAYAATDSGVFQRAHGDSAWHPLNNGLTALDVRALAGDDNSTLVAGTSDGMFSWNTFILNPYWRRTSAPDVAVHALSLVSSNPLMSYPQVAGTSGGAFFTFEDGGHWNAINDGLPDGIEILAATVDHQGSWQSYMMVGAETGIWRRPIQEVVASVRPQMGGSRHAEILRLDGNHTASFKLPARTPVSLTMHDLSGRTRATLLSGELVAGNHTARLDAVSLPSGLYFVRLQTPEFSETRRVLLTE